MPTSAPHVLVVQHEAHEPMGIVAHALADAGLAARVLHPWSGEPVPHDPGDAAGLVVLGGSMGVYEQREIPHLRDELRLVERALARGVPVLGICLGSQLLASALGADVRATGRMEIGWLPIEWTRAAADDPVVGPTARDGAPFVPLHWHGDVFDLPHGAVPLARSAMTAHQAYVAEGAGGAPAYGFLFHPEVDATIAAAMVDAFAHEARAAGLEPDALRAEIPARVATLAPTARGMFARWAGAVRGGVGQG